MHDNPLGNNSGFWKTISSSSDLISFEKKAGNGYRIRIEARLDKGLWNIFKTYCRGNEVSFMEEYTTETRQEAQNVVRSLQKEQDLPPAEIMRIRKARKKFSLKMQREYKEYEVEKWLFSVNSESMVNFATVRFYESIGVDVVLHESYRFLESRILDEIVHMLGLKEFGLDIEKRVYFFSRRTILRSRPKRKGMLISKMEMEFSDFRE